MIRTTFVFSSNKDHTVYVPANIINKYIYNNEDYFCAPVRPGQLAVLL